MNQLKDPLKYENITFVFSVRIGLTMSCVCRRVVLSTAGCGNMDCMSLIFSRVGCHTSVRGAEVLLVYCERQRERRAALVHYFLVFVPQQ